MIAAWLYFRVTLHDLTRALSIYLVFTCVAGAFSQQDSTAASGVLAQDDPSQFLTRTEVFNELQYRKGVGYLNMFTARAVVALGKRMTTRVDIPVLYNSAPVEGYDHSGLGDISVRLLGYKIMESRRAAMLASVEFSFNTAQSRLLGTGKNIISPVIAYSWRIPQQKSVVAFVVQQFYSLWGDESRNDISWTKVQGLHLHAWSKRIWTLANAELYFDHLQNGRASMNLEGALYYRVSGRFALWIKGGAGLFGDHPARYTWSAETGLRYLMMRKSALQLMK